MTQVGGHGPPPAHLYLKIMESHLSLVLEKEITPLAIFVQFLHSIEIHQISAWKFEI